MWQVNALEFAGSDFRRPHHRTDPEFDSKFSSAIWRVLVPTERSDWESAGQSWLPVTRRPSRQNELCLATSRYIHWGFVIFLSCKAYVGVQLEDKARTTSRDSKVLTEIFLHLAKAFNLYDQATLISKPRSSSQRNSSPERHFVFGNTSLRCDLVKTKRERRYRKQNPHYSYNIFVTLPREASNGREKLKMLNDVNMRSALN